MTLDEAVTVEKSSLNVVDLEIKDYSRALAIQEQLRDFRMKDIIGDTILLLEHNHVYTQGKDVVDVKEMIRRNLPAPLVNIERGGKITYHGPGQLVGYLICKVPVSNLGHFVDAVEDLTIGILKDYGLAAYSRKDERDEFGKNIRGAWIDVYGVPRKIAAQGIETKRVSSTTGNPEIVTMHGFALNVNTDLSYFNCIRPCGFDYNVMTSMLDISGSSIDMKQLKENMKARLERWAFK
jgi:lipoyl(octanoyl) transferase